MGIRKKFYLWDSPYLLNHDLIIDFTELIVTSMQSISFSENKFYLLFQKNPREKLENQNAN